MGKMRTNKFTAVIATLGHECLEETLESLISSKIVPDEILICTPNKSFIKLTPLLSKHVKVIETLISGQVYQRMLGFINSKSNFVMQLDDDVLLDYLCTEELLKAITELGDSCSVSPALIGRDTGKSLYSEEMNSSSFLKKLYYWLIN